MSSRVLLRSGAGLEQTAPAIHRALVAPAYERVGRRLADRLGARGGRVLECGCGTGSGLIRLGRELGPAFALTGIDVEPRLIRHARRQAGQGGVRFEPADVRNLPFPDDHFDGVFCVFSILHHLPRPEAVRALREMLRVLKPGGEWFCTTPNRAMSQDLYHPNPDDSAAFRFNPLNAREYRRDELPALLERATTETAAFGAVAVGGLYNAPFAACWQAAIRDLRARAFEADGARRPGSRWVRALLPPSLRVRGFLRHLEAHRRGLGIALDEIGRTARDETPGAGEPLHWVVTAVKTGRKRDA